MLRKRKRRERLARILGLDADEPGREVDPEGMLLEKEAAISLWSAVGQLPDKYRWTVHLRFEQELTVAEIAQVLSISEKTVYSRLYEAFRLLKEGINETHPP